MDFGRDNTTDINSIDFSLPPDNIRNHTVLRGSPYPKSKVYVGTGKMGHKYWQGKLYPEKINERDFLKEYAKHFNYLELNATFYTTFKKEVVQKWREQVEGHDFLFCPKFPKYITHFQLFKNTEATTKTFLDLCLTLSDKLGPSLMQLPDTFTTDAFPSLIRYLKQLPESFEVNVELRHKSWFENKEILHELFDMLQERGLGTVLMDTNVRRDALHMTLTNSEAYVRFNGNNNHRTDERRMEEWKQKIIKWREAGIKRVFFNLYQPDDKEFADSAAHMLTVFRDLIR